MQEHKHDSYSSSPSQIHWQPKVLWIGIGCERGTSEQLIETAIQQVFEENQLAETAIAGIATIDKKSDEAGLVELCRKRNFPLKTFSSDILNKISVPNPSQVVEQKVKTRSVAEAAALCAAQGQTLLVAKQIFKSSPPLQGAVTIAVAREEKDLLSD